MMLPEWVFRAFCVFAVCWVLVVAALGLMAVSAVVYHVFDPGCSMVFCFGGE